MVRIVLVMHEPMGAAFSACAEHVLGRRPDMTVFDVPPDGRPDDLVPRLEQLLMEHSADETLVLCDLYGATPFNIAVQALKQGMARGLVAHLITGTNVCMVLKALTDQSREPEKLAERVRQGALRGIVSADEACCNP